MWRINDDDDDDDDVIAVMYLVAFDGNTYIDFLCFYVKKEPRHTTF